MEVVFFVIFATIALAFVCLSQAPIYTVFLRVLDPQDKSFGIGVMLGFQQLIGKKECMPVMNSLH